MAQTNTFADLYSPYSEHCLEDIQKAISMEEAEQKRRMADKEGETFRRAIAGQVSDMFSLGLRETWFHRGSSFVLNLLGSVKQSGKEMWNSQPVRTLNAKIQVAGQKGVAAASDVTTSVASTAGEVGHKVQETALTLKDKSIGLAQGIKERSVETAQGVSTKAQEKAQDFKTKGIETAQDAKEIIKEQVEKVQGFGGKIKIAVTSMSLYKKLNKSFSNLGSNANVAFVYLEEENERAYRMSSPTEVQAMYNAMMVSQLIKGLDTFYRPTSEPSTHYFTKQLEANERARRVQTTETSAINNAKAVSQLITQKFTVPVAIPPAKAQIVEEIKVSKPLVATM